VSLEASGVEGVDLVSFLAAIPAGVNPQIRAVRAQLATREEDLRSAVGENLVVLNGEIDNEQSQLNQIRADQANFPELENRLDELNIQLGLDQETVRFLTS
jgi:hypothetical protein